MAFTLGRWAFMLGAVHALGGCGGAQTEAGADDYSGPPVEGDAAEDFDLDEAPDPITDSPGAGGGGNAGTGGNGAADGEGGGGAATASTAADTDDGNDGADSVDGEGEGAGDGAGAGESAGDGDRDGAKEGAGSDDANHDADDNGGGGSGDDRDGVEENGTPANQLDGAQVDQADQERLEGPLTSGAADNPYQCIWQETQDAALCGYETVRDGVLCGYETVRDGTLCGTRIVRDGAVCGYSYVQSGAECGYSTVKSGAECGYSYVTSGAECGYRTVTSAAQCGYKTITDGAKCGWDFLGAIFGGKQPKSCQVAASCQVADSCQVAKTCSVARSCNVPGSCEVDAQCEVDAMCDIPARCDVEICKQTTPGGQCTPGLAECDIEGFACQVSADSDVFRCLPNYNTDMNAADRAVCEAQYDPMLAALAKADGETFAYSSGSAAAAVASTSYETGTVYGEDGEYGCFVSSCVGLQSDVNIGVFANLAVYLDWDYFAGNAKTFFIGASVPGIELGVATASVTSSEYDQYIGQVDSVSLGVGLAPAQVGHMSCNTTVFQTRTAED